MELEPPESIPRRSRTPLSAIAAMVGVCLAGLAVRLWLGWWMGYLADIQCWQLWGLDDGEYVSRPEYASIKPLPNNYPPMYASVLRILRWVHRGLDLPGDYTTPLEVHFHDDPGKWRPLILYLKLPPVLSDLVTACLLFLIGRHFGRVWLGVGLAAFYAFSPGILYDGAYFGQTDTILVMFLVAAVWAYLRNRPMWLGAMVMAAPLMKAQAVFALPVLGLAVLGQWRIWRPHFWRIALGGMASLAMVLALAAWTGLLGQLYSGYFTVVGHYPLTTVSAYNLWWLLTRPWDKPPQPRDFPDDSVCLFGLISYRAIGAVLFFTVLGLILWRLHKARYTPYALVLAMAAAGWAFFNLPTQMHERYMIPAVGLMTLLPLWGPKWWIAATASSITAALNIARVCYFLFPPSKLLTGMINQFIFHEAHPSWLLFAVIQILMLPLTLGALWREGKPAPTAPPPREKTNPSPTPAPAGQGS